MPPQAEEPATRPHQGDMEDHTPLLSQDAEHSMEERPKRRKPGIVYLSSIPPNMNVAKMREYFSKFGALDRMFLQAMDKDSSKGSKVKKFKKNLHFTEGWLEFKSKRKAKQVHMYLNNQAVGGKRKNPQYDTLWNIKYLPRYKTVPLFRFKWAYLKQRLEYEREVMRQRMGAEISQVTKETDHFLKLSDISNKKKKRKSKEMSGKEGEGVKEGAKGEDRDKVFIFKQKDTEEEKLSKKEERNRKNELFKKRIVEKKKKKQKRKSERPEDILESVFVGAS
ncbi:Activator of basal transcription 1 [Chionoecetes opilio]|uniref:Activator of basal transcription 1 n=1 Tax=Chionoecetes opilio TaxID=41210 RepID=A0A8J4XMW5_CHIOP|nr:Activator of basal transcription 1 [Chionoecetes opilio]